MDKKVWLQNIASLPERKKEFKTLSGLSVDAVYTKEDIQGDLGMPGDYPYTRGVYPTMYRGRLWTMRQYAGFGSAKESNKRYKYLLEKGQTGLSVAFDLPTQIGYDSDHYLAKGEVGRVGVAIDSLQDMEVLFADIPLDKVSTSMTINATAPVLLAMYLALAEKRGIPFAKLSGTIQNDILKEYVARGTYIFPPQESMRLITDVFAYCHEHVPNWNTISISGYHIREAGSSAVQELAFTIANGIAYVEAAIEAGMKVDDFAPRLSFFFNSQMDFLEEIAKFRAARRIWAEIMKERFGAKDPKSMMLRFHTQTAGSALSAQQPENNVVRVTLQALAAVLGGTQSLHTNALDEALGLPTERTAEIALRTQQIIAYESGVVDTVDPLAGSYYLESLTDQVETEVKRYLDRIEVMGGAVKAIETGYMQKEIQNSAYRYQVEVENNERLVVGINAFADQREEDIEILRLDPLVERLQEKCLRELKESRDTVLVEKTLKELKEKARSTENLMPYILEAVKAYATLGEISDVLRNVFGEYAAKELI